VWLDTELRNRVIYLPVPAAPTADARTTAPEARLDRLRINEFHRDAHRPDRP